MKKILITGASGFIGSFLTEEAFSRNYSVWAGIRSESIQPSMASGTTLSSLCVLSAFVGKIYPTKALRTQRKYRKF